MVVGTIVPGTGIFRHEHRPSNQFRAVSERNEHRGKPRTATETPKHPLPQAEIDAAAFHTYGLDPEQTKFVLDDFHRVGNPRVMDEAYFESCWSSTTT